jgi:hypothetical protein
VGPTWQVSQYFCCPRYCYPEIWMRWDPPFVASGAGILRFLNFFDHRYREPSSTILISGSLLLITRYRKNHKIALGEKRAFFPPLFALIFINQIKYNITSHHPPLAPLVPLSVLPLSLCSLERESCLLGISFDSEFEQVAYVAVKGNCIDLVAIEL